MKLSSYSLGSSDLSAGCNSESISAPFPFMAVSEILSGSFALPFTPSMAAGGSTGFGTCPETASYTGSVGDPAPGDCECITDPGYEWNSVGGGQGAWPEPWPFSKSCLDGASFSDPPPHDGEGNPSEPSSSESPKSSLGGTGLKRSESNGGGPSAFEWSKSESRPGSAVGTIGGLELGCGRGRANVGTKDKSSGSSDEYPVEVSDDVVLYAGRGRGGLRITTGRSLLSMSTSSIVNCSNSLRQTKQFPRADRPVDAEHDAEQDGSIDGAGLAVEDARFGAGLDNECVPGESIDFPDILKYSSPSFPKPSSHRFPNTVVMLLGMFGTSTDAWGFPCPNTGAARSKSMMERMRRIPVSMSYRRIFVMLVG